MAKFLKISLNHQKVKFSSWKFSNSPLTTLFVSMSEPNQTVNEFFFAFSNADVSVWVEDPLSHKEPGKFVGSKSFLTYQVIQKTPGRDAVGKRHRFSEFEKLRESLKVG